MANEQNLTHRLNAEDRIKGGKKSGEKRRLQGAIKMALSSSADNDEFKELFDRFGIEEGSRDYASAIACAIINKAARGDVSSAAYIRDTAGEKLKEELSVDSEVVIVDDIKA